MSLVTDRLMEPTEAELFAESLTAKAEKVKIYIGEKTPDSNPYEVTKAILLEYEYFRMALSSNWPEGQNNTLHFPEDSKEAWAVILHYLYRDKVEWPGYDEADPCINTDEDEFRGDKNLLIMAYAFALADMYLLPSSFKNKIIRACMNGCKQEQIFYEETYIEFFAIVDKSCPLRRIVLENLIVWVKSRYRARTLTGQGYGWLKEYPDVWADLKEYLSMRARDWGGWDKLHEEPPYERLDEEDERMKEYFVYDPEEDDG